MLSYTGSALAEPVGLSVQICALCAHLTYSLAGAACQGNMSAQPADEVKVKSVRLAHTFGYLLSAVDRSTAERYNKVSLSRR